MITEGQRHAHEVRQRLMNGNPPRTPVVALPPEPEAPTAPEPLRYDIPWRDGVKAILRQFGESRSDVCSPRRGTRLVACRWAVANYLRQRGWSTTRIGEFLDRDHSTVVLMLADDARKEHKRSTARERSRRRLVKCVA